MAHLACDTWQAEPCDPADVQSLAGGPIPLLDPAVVTAAVATATTEVAVGGDAGPIPPTIAEAPAANDTATTGGGGGNAPEAPLQALQALQEQARPVGTQKGQPQEVEDLRSPVMVTVAAPPSGAEGAGMQRQGSGRVEGPTPMPGPTPVPAHTTVPVVASQTDRLPDKGVSFADPGAKAGTRTKADRPKGSTHMMQRQVTQQSTCRTCVIARMS